MHGFIFSEIRSYVDSKLGGGTWQALLEHAGLKSRRYENFLEYPDEEAVSIVVAASSMTGLQAQDILEDFGQYVGGDLLRVYRPLIDPQWKTLEFLGNIEATIHHIVRSRNRQAKPPMLTATRLGPDEILIVYGSPRKMCALAKGIIRGVAKHYNEQVDVREETCMHNGDPRCRIQVIRKV